MAGINSVILVGRLTKDAELYKTKSGTSYCRFSVAIDRPKKKDEQTSTADFPNVLAWRQQAEYIGNYGRKGAMVAVQGSIQTGSYTDRDGRKVYTTEVLANNVQLLEGKKNKADYPNYGTSLRPEDIDTNDGFDTGSTSASIPDDDLPF